MHIRPLSSEPRPSPVRQSVRAAETRHRAPRGGDRFERQRRSPEDEPPFWVVAMATDRLARRRYMTDRDRRAAGRLEARWVAQLAARSAPLVRAWKLGLAGPPALADWQALALVICEAAELEAVPRLVWQRGMREDRGQFLFRLEGHLIQLRPGAPGTLADWGGTVAHETYHHLQQEWVSALYRGEPPAGEAERLAPYFRDARSVYQGRGPACPPERHRLQDLERGAWAFGAAIAHELEKG